MKKKFDVKRSEQGAVMLEGMVAVALFFTLLAGIIDAARGGYLCIAGQFAVNDTARWAAVGLEPDPQQRAANAEARFIYLMGRLGIAVSPEQLSICPASDPDCSTDTAGGPEEFFVLKYQTPLLLFSFPTGVHITAYTLARNEPYQPQS